MVTELDNLINSKTQIENDLRKENKIDKKPKTDLENLNKLIEKLKTKLTNLTKTRTKID